METTETIITDHALVAYDLELRVAAVVYRGTFEQCKKMFFYAVDNHSELRYAVMNRDKKVVYAPRVTRIKIDLGTILVAVALILAFTAYHFWG